MDYVLTIAFVGSIIIAFEYFQPQKPCPIECRDEDVKPAPKEKSNPARYFLE